MALALISFGQAWGDDVILSFSSGTLTGADAAYTEKGTLDTNKYKFASSNNDGSANYVELTLKSGTFAEGDQISITYYANSDTKSVTPGLFFGTKDGEGTFSSSYSVQADATSNTSASPVSQNLTVTASGEGSNVLRLTRHTGGTALFVTALTITREAAGVKDPVFSLTKSSIELDGSSQIQVGTKGDLDGITFNGTITFGTEGIVTVNSSGVITPIAVGTTTINFNTNAVAEKYNASSDNSLSISVTATCEVPTFTIGSYNYNEGGYAITPACATDGATLTYKVGSGETQSCTAGTPFYAKDGSLVITASKSGYTTASSSAVTLNSAPASKSPETLIQFNKSKDDYDKDAIHSYKSVTIPATYIAGIYSANTGLKLRCSKTLTLGDETVKAFSINVNSGYRITGVKFTNLKSNRAGTINVAAMYVDGTAVASFETFDIPVTSGDAITKEFNSLNAISQIAWKLIPGKYDTTKDVDQFVATIEVTYQPTTTNVTVGEKLYRTFASKYPLDFTSPIDGLTAYRATVDGDNVSFVEVNTLVPAGEGLLLKATTAKEYTIPVATSTPDAITNALVGVTTATEVDPGTFVLYDNEGELGFYKTSATKFTVSANTAYLPAGASSRNFIALDGETTAIKEIKAATQQDVYNLSGQRVSQPAKGLYIVNGKKIMVK